MSGAASWSFREEDANRIGTLLDRLLAESSARTALLVDRAGQRHQDRGPADRGQLGDRARPERDTTR